MLNGLEHSELLTERLSLGSWAPAAPVRQELINLALTQSELPFLAASIFELFRKKSGQPIVLEYFTSLQELASGGTAAGARLLAAFLNVSTPGERLVPRLQQLDSGRRYEIELAGLETEPGQLQSDWLRRLHLCRVESARLRASGALPAADEAAVSGPRSRQPWPELRGVAGCLLQRAAAGDLRAGSPECTLLASLMRLEIDAWQERVSRLAGRIDPLRVAAVERVLPWLNRADAQIRDLRQMTAWVHEGNFEAAFVLPQPRWRETIEDKDWAHLHQDLRRRPELSGLARLAGGLTEKPILLAQLAMGVQRIISVSESLVAAGVRSESLDLFTACVLAQTHYGNGQIVFTLDHDLVVVLESVLPATGAQDHPLQGVSVVAGLLVIELSATAPELEHGLPVQREDAPDEKTALAALRQAKGLLIQSAPGAPAEQGIDLEAVGGQPEVLLGAVLDEAVEKDISTAALKHLVLTNIQSVSVLLGFLRNPKVYGIPGLVADVAARTRNPQIIAVIATDRALHTGFANKGVPVACLRSPVNVSVKILRKFCHVKYVSKLELKRLAADRTGIRKEVAREIEKYLEALA